MRLKRPRTRRLLLLVLVLAGVGLVLAGCGNGSDLPQSALNPNSEKAEKIDTLFWITVAVAIVILVGVMAALLYASFRFRHREGRDEQVKQVHGNSKLEVAWTIAPALILAGLAVPTVRTVFDISAEPPDALQVTVIGHQWWWEFIYEDLGVVTANELHIPVGRDVYLSMSTDDLDVIHSFWVPPLSGKRDVVPGQVNNLALAADSPGLYLGQCAEFCGLAHADMRLRVFADEPDDFDAWVEDQLSAANLADEGIRAEGWELFLNRGCSACHAVNGTEAEGGGVNPGPNLTHFASRTTFASATWARTDENLAAWLENPSALKPMQPELNRGMPNLGLSDEEIVTLVAWLQGLE